MGAYQCNCKQVFTSPEERTAHTADCAAFLHARIKNIAAAAAERESVLLATLYRYVAGVACSGILWPHTSQPCGKCDLLARPYIAPLDRVPDMAERAAYLLGHVGVHFNESDSCSVYTLNRDAVEVRCVEGLGFGPHVDDIGNCENNPTVPMICLANNDSAHLRWFGDWVPAADITLAVGIVGYLCGTDPIPVRATIQPVAPPSRLGGA